MCIYIYTRVKWDDELVQDPFFFLTGWCPPLSLGLLRLSSSYLIWEDWWLDHPDPIGISLCVSSERVDMRNATSLPLQLPLWRPQDDGCAPYALAVPSNRPSPTDVPMSLSLNQLGTGATNQWSWIKKSWNLKKKKNSSKFKFSYSFPWKSPAVSLFH